ncbi:MAG: hypothetical protein KJO79_05805 [Verrucomicrobiae bacterium]|nr:hypothetical protein [Verrucomicrobiae bacterium]NNJ86678.1 hypothetical protein [Akkermansiaceae bacterium]
MKIPSIKTTAILVTLSLMPVTAGTIPVKKELLNGEVTIAVKSFIRQSSHKGRDAPPTSHLSVLMQSALLTPPVLAFHKKTKKK